MVTFDEVLEGIFSESETTKEQGDAFERATVYYLQNDPLYSNRFSDVWLWQDSPTCTGHDIGIDVVARDAEDGTYWAIQCKCYQEDSSLTYEQVSTFFATAAADKSYGHYMIVDTANTWSPHLRGIAEKYGAVRISGDALREAELDWEPFLKGKGRAERETHDVRPHQRDAIDAVAAGLEEADRGKLVMACGTGKTLTALRLAEEMCPEGAVLFLAPSISLVSQTLRAWANEVRVPLRPFVVCSDAKASRLEDIWDTGVADVPFPATTDAAELARQIKRTATSGEMTVVFSTYQSIQVVIDAQKRGRPPSTCASATRRTARPAWTTPRCQRRSAAPSPRCTTRRRSRRESAST